MTRKLQIYDAPEITVSFDPNVCRHTGVCLRMLPAVFDVRRARWIHADTENPDQVAAAVQKCPSGALQFYRNVSRNPAAATRLARAVLLNQVALCVDGPGTRADRAGAVSAAIVSARGYDYVGVYDVLDKEIVALGWSGETPPENPRFSSDRGLCGAVARSAETLIVNDVTTDSRYITTSPSTLSEMVVPVGDPATRAVVGTIDAASNRRDVFGDEDRELLEECGRTMLSLWTEDA